MLAFDANDLFPLLGDGDYTYAEAQQHAALVDDFLGLRAKEIEEKIEAERGARTLSDQPQLWIGHPIQSFMTPYVEIRGLLEKLRLQPGEKIVDLGAAYGRMGFVLGRHFPDVSFIGYELVRERVIESRRCLEAQPHSRIEMQEADLASADFFPSAAEYYFLYDYGTRAAIEKTLQDLRSIARQKKIAVIGRGRASRDAIEQDHPWLSQVNRPEHYPHYSIYHS